MKMSACINDLHRFVKFFLGNLPLLVLTALLAFVLLGKIYHGLLWGALGRIALIYFIFGSIAFVAFGIAKEFSVKNPAQKWKQIITVSGVSMFIAFGYSEQFGEYTFDDNDNEIKFTKHELAAAILTPLIIILVPGLLGLSVGRREAELDNINEDLNSRLASLESLLENIWVGRRGGSDDYFYIKLNKSNSENFYCGSCHVNSGSYVKLFDCNTSMLCPICETRYYHKPIQN